MPHDRAQLLRMNAALAWHSPRAAHWSQPDALSTHATHWPHESGHCLLMYALFESHCPALAQPGQLAEASAHGSSFAAAAAALRAAPCAGMAVAVGGFFRWHMSHERGHSLAMSAHRRIRPRAATQKGAHRRANQAGWRAWYSVGSAFEARRRGTYTLGSFGTRPGSSSPRNRLSCRRIRPGG